MLCNLFYAFIITLLILSPTTKRIRRDLYKLQVDGFFAGQQATWQSEWDCSTKGRTTHALIPNIAAWTSRKHGEVNFYMTQFLSDHGCFRNYLHKYRHASSPDCPACVSIVDSAELVLFHRPRFAEERHEITVKCGTTINGTNLTEVMLKNAGTWEVIANGMRSILLKL